jgi:amino acid adenylation domain-containing protein
MADLESGLSNGSGTVSHAATFLPSITGESVKELRHQISSVYGFDDREIEDIYPCVPMQVSMFSMSSRDFAGHIMHGVMDLSPAASVDRFRAAWEEAYRSSAILRTRIIHDNEYGFLQVVLRENISWVEVDDASAYLQNPETAHMGFGQALSRYGWVRGKNGKKSQFIWTAHHAVMDSWTAAILSTQVIRHYNQRPCPSPVQFRTYVEHLQQKDFQAATRYWGETLKQCDCVEFPGTLTKREPEAFARAEHISTEMTWQNSGLKRSALAYAAWSLVVGSMTGFDSVVFGTVTSGRRTNLENVKFVTGPTVCTVPAYIEIDWDQSVSTFVTDVGNETSKREKFDFLGLSNIKKITANAAKACDFGTLLVVQGAEAALDVDRNIGEWTTRPEDAQVTLDSLSLEVFIGATRTKIVANYDTRLLDEGTINMLMSELSYVMQQFTKGDSAQKLRDIKLLTPKDEEKLWARNRTVPNPIAHCAHDRIIDQAKKQPNSQAVSAWDGDLTYAELDNLSSILAQQLLDFGVGPSSLVPLFFEKSRWVSVAIIATLKTGGAFLMIDPTHPEARIQSIIEQVGAVVALSSTSNLPLSSRLVDRSIAIGAHLTQEKPASSSKPLPIVEPSSAMYVVFTSGSTGTPKGVIVSHTAFSTNLFYQADLLGFKSSSRVYDFANHVFDDFIYYTVTTFVKGGCLCIPLQSDRFDNLMGSIVETQATLLYITTSVSRLLDPAQLPRVKTVVTGGEAVTLYDTERWWGYAKLINAYGPAECTTNSVVNVNPKSPETATKIGKGLGLLTWIVHPTDYNKLMPIGMIGELLLEGPLLGLGYLKDPKKTAEAFIQDPAWLLAGGRSGTFYKTGDLVRYSEDGNLIYIGRKDTQVKINGQRIELGEVEYQVRAYVPLAKQAEQVVAEVVTPAGTDASPMLMVFLSIPFQNGLTPQPESRSKMGCATTTTQLSLYPISTDVEDKLTGHLPSYMVPSVIFTLPHLPTTTTGKIDRKTLCEMASSFSPQELADLRSQSESQNEKRMPSTPMEQALQHLWARVLDISTTSIGLDDSFFRLGGSSITAMRLVSEGHKDQLSLSVADVFQKPKLEAMSQCVLKARPDTGKALILPFSLLGDAFQVSHQLHAIATNCGLSTDRIEDVYPCTPLQQGLFALTSKRQGDYVLQLVLELSENIDMERFCTSWEQVTQESVIMRTRIVQQSEFGLLQVVTKDSINWFKATNLQEYLEADKLTPMELGQPIVRYAIIRDAESGRNWFTLTLHHAVYDGPSLPLLFDSVRDIYAGVPSKPIGNFKIFIRHLLQSSGSVNVQYWQSELEGYQSVPFPPLPAQVSQPLANANIEAQCVIPAAENSEFTIASVARAAWALAVYSQTGTTDVVFGAITSGRSAPLPGIETIVGPTIATVPVRIRIQPDQTLLQYLQAVQTQMIEMIPFEQSGLQGIAKASPDARRACDIQTLLVIQPQDDEYFTDSDSTFGQWQVKSNHHQFNTYSVAVSCYLQQGGIRVEASYDSRVVGDWEIKNIVNQFTFIVQKLAQPGETDTISDIATLTPRDREAIWSWNKTVPPPVEFCTHNWIVEQAHKQPDALAISAWDGDLTYGELDSLSSLLAHRLLDLGAGVGPWSLIPLCFEKSKWVSVAILAVLKTGSAFIMIDPGHPEPRLRSIIEQASATIVLSSVSNLSLSSRLVKCPIAVGADLVETEAAISTSLSEIGARLPQVDPSSPMYVVFTSGSTGTPKGVIVSHSAFAANIFYQADELIYNSNSRVYDFTNHIFDMFIHYTITTLAKGGCLCVPAEAERISNLTSSLVRMEPSHIELTPSVARLLDPTKLPFVETIGMGGEAITPYDAERWWGHVKLINGYGPAECTPTSIINSSAKSPKEVIRIGKGLGAVTWVVNPEDHEELMPVGMTGELLLEGPLLGLGYLKDPEKTKAAFIQDPRWLQAGSSQHPGRSGTLYKTGDLVQYIDDGSLIYKGRKDTQVKVNGQRIELGEVEYQVRVCVPLAEHVVAEVITPTSEKASPMLAVFLSQSQESTSDKDHQTTTQLSIFPISTDIKNKLAEHLPIYMIPAVVFTLASVPITATGKTDRKRLREMAAGFSLQELVDARNQTENENKGEKRMPSTHMEEVLQNLWARVLNIDAASIGLDDSFFQLGGDSITAMQISSTARSLRINLPTSEILHKKTIGWLSQNLPSNSNKISKGPTIELFDHGFGLSPIQTMYFQVQPEGRACIDQNCYLQLVGTRTTAAQLSDALRTLTERHSMLRGRFKQDFDGVWEQYVPTSTNSSFVIQHVESNEPTATTKAITQSRASLDIENGHVLAAVLIDKEDTQFLFLTIHHLVVDLVSWRILLQELEDLLLSRSLLPEPMLNFQAWLALQNEYVATKMGAGDLVPYETQPNQLSYWGLEPNIPLSNFTVTENFDLDAQTTDSLLGSCNEAFQTRPLELMIAALAHSFSVVFPDRAPPTIFNETHGRETWDDEIDLSRTVGWFTSMFPIDMEQTTTGNLFSSVCEVKDLIRSLPRVGWGKFASGFSNQKAAYNPWSAFPVEVTFNYAGRFQQLERDDSVFKFMSIPKGCKRLPSESAAGRISLFDISVAVDEGGAHVSVTYSRGIRLREKVSAWVQQYKATLLEMTTLLPNKSTQWTLSDLPLAFKSYEDLNMFRDVTIPSLGIKIDDVEDVFPCSAMQQGILVGQAKDTSRYRSCDLSEVISSKQIDCHQLQQAWKTVAQRHQLLRTLVVDSIPGRDGFAHVILKDPVPNVSFFRAAGDSMSLEQIHAQYPEATYEQLGLQYHAVVCQLETGRVFFYLYMNHAIEDAHSRGLIMRDLQTAYTGQLEVRSAQYRDVVAYLEAQSLDEAKEYWTTYLQSAEPTYFPAMADSRNQQNEEGIVEVHQVNAHAIYAFCRKWDITPATLIQTTWALVLKHYSGCGAPCFGNISSGRDLPVDGVHGIVGPLICMLPCRVQFESQDTVLDTLRSVQDNHMKGLSYQTFPLAQVHKAIGLGKTALFNTALSLQRDDSNDDKVDPQIKFESRDFLDPDEVSQTYRACL